MSPDEILATVGELARSELPASGTIGAESRLVEDLGASSIHLLSLATAVEDRFEIRLDEADEGSVSTIGDLAALVVRKLAATPAEEVAG